MPDQTPENPQYEETTVDSYESLIFETSPFGNLDAIVQHDGRSVYLYLNGRSSESNPNFAAKFGTRACWVRNLKIGPYVINEDEMRAGIAPMLPRTHCKSNEPGQLPDADDLEIIWFEEGNGVALIERSSSKTLAVIPPWSGIDGFLGYAAECASESPLCWPLPDNPMLHERIKRAQNFWHAFSPNNQAKNSQEKSSLAKTDDPFATLQQQTLNIYDQRFGSNQSANLASASSDQSDPPDLEIDKTGERDYYSIDGNTFPPRGLVRYRSQHRQVLATVGMPLCPQPNVELATDNPSQFRRIELAIEVAADMDESLVQKIIENISSLAAYPWRQLSWFGHGHTCQFTNVFGNVDSAILICDDQLKIARQDGSERDSLKSFCEDPKQPSPLPPRLPPHRGDRVNLLWLFPLTSEQREQVTAGKLSAAEIVAQSSREMGKPFSQ